MSVIATSRPPAAQQRWLRRRLVVALATLVLLAVASPAYAYWTATSTGPYGRAQASTLAAPGLTTGAITARSVALSWTQPFTPSAYALSQSPGSLAGCPATPTTGSSGCTATGLTPNTSYTWTLSASLHAWVSPATVTATTSRQTTTTTLSNNTPTTGPAGTTFSATATVSGDSGYGTPAGTAVFSLYTSPTCSGTASYTSTAQTLSGGTASAAVQPAASTYYWRAAFTPTDSYNAASTSSCSAAVTVTPAPGTYAAAGTPVTVTATTTNLSVPYPAGTSAGDLVLLVVVNNTSQSTSIGSSGWTLIANPSLGGSRMQLTAWWHTAGAESSVALSSLLTDSQGATAWVLDYKNMPNPALAGVSSGTAMAAKSLTPANLTTTTANSTVISLAAINAPRTLSLITARAFVGQAALQDTTSTGRALGVADRFATTAGTLTPPSWTNNVNQPDQWAYITMAFTS